MYQSTNLELIVLVPDLAELPLSFWPLGEALSEFRAFLGLSYALRSFGCARAP